VYERRLTPKGPRCLSWQYKFFGQVPTTRDFYVFGPNLIEVVDEEYLSCPPNFRAFGNMSQKLWPNM